MCPWCVEDMPVNEDGAVDRQSLQENQIAVVALPCMTVSPLLVGVEHSSAGGGVLNASLGALEKLRAVVVEDLAQHVDALAPITPSTVRSVLENNPGCITHSGKQFVASFCRVQPDSGDLKVKYGSRCSHPCSQINPGDVMDMRDDLRSLWAKWFPNKAEVVRADPLMVIEIYPSGGGFAHQRKFAMLFGCSGS